jgi:flagellar hook-length control protein FliK
MTIETRNAQNGPRPAASAESKGARVKPGGSEDAGAAATGGFTAILASFDSSDAPAPGETAAVDPPLTVSAGTITALEPQGQPTKRGEKVGNLIGVLTPAVPVDADEKKGLQKDELTDAAATLLASANGSVQAGISPDASLASGQSMQWSAVLGSSPVAVNPGQATGPTADAATAPTLLHSVVKAESAPAKPGLAVDMASEYLGKASKTQKDAQTRLASMDAAFATSVESQGQPDPRGLPVSSRVTESPVMPMAAALVMASAPALIRRENQADDRSVFRTNVTESAVVTQSFLLPASSTSVQAAPDMQSSTDIYVAQKVAYWISNDVQNAQMKLDGIGIGPVEVSIRMQGNEAHVAFRTDELQARVALENASVHLKDLLQREGLVLGGVSVGTSGTGDSGDQERRPRQGVRQSVIGVVQAAPADRSAVVGRVAGRALDLFV